MPNWTNNTITFQTTKERAAVILLQIKTENSDFDFNTIIPMPESLNVEHGSKTNEAIVYFLSDKLEKSYESLLENSWAAQVMKKLVTNSFAGTEEEWISEVYKRVSNNVKEYSDAKKEEFYQLGSVYVNNYLQNGYTTWYDWCRNNWGTKWNACDAQVDLSETGKVTICFDTAWSAPEPVFQALSEKFPDVRFQTCSIYEDDCWTEYYSEWEEGLLVSQWEEIDEEAKAEYEAECGA